MDNRVTPKVLSQMKKIDDANGATSKHIHQVYNLGIKLVPFLTTKLKEYNVDPADFLLGLVLHDIGKSEYLESFDSCDNIDPEIKLYHPILGAKILTPSFGYDNIVTRIAEEHHERPDGSGYPYALSRLNEDNIHPLMSYVTIIDVASAACGRGTYNNKIPVDNIIGDLLGGREISDDAKLTLDQKLAKPLEESARVFLN